MTIKTLTHEDVISARKDLTECGLKQIAREMTPEQIAEAKRLVGAWKPG